MMDSYQNPSLVIRDSASGGMGWMEEEGGEVKATADESPPLWINYQGEGK